MSEHRDRHGDDPGPLTTALNDIAHELERPDWRRVHGISPATAAYFARLVRRARDRAGGGR